MSELQQEASRANGAKSRGPITEEGKQASSQNRRTHGLLSKKIVLEGESQEEFDELFNSYLEEHKPESPTERSLIESMAAARWRQERVWTLETAAMDDQMRRPRYHEAEEDFASKAYVAFHTLANAGPSFELLSRYEARHERQFRAALNTFLSLRAKRTLAERARKAVEPGDDPDWKPPVSEYTWDGEKRVRVCPVPEPEPIAEPIPDPTPETIDDDLAPAAASGSYGKPVLNDVSAFIRLYLWLKEVSQQRVNRR
jgi:rubrerythrin